MRPPISSTDQLPRCPIFSCHVCVRSIDIAVGIVIIISLLVIIKRPMSRHISLFLGSSFATAIAYTNFTIRKMVRHSLTSACYEKKSGLLHQQFTQVGGSFAVICMVRDPFSTHYKRQKCSRHLLGTSI